MIEIPCVIFAGGKSSRMGEDKSLLPFGGFDTLTQFQLSRLSKIFKTVYISCKDKNKFDFEAKFIEDIKTDSVYAPTIGFVAIFESIKDESFFAISVDSPFISKDEIEKILEADTIHTKSTSPLPLTTHVDATIAKTNSGIQPMCGIYHRSLKSKFVKMLKENNHKLWFLLKSSNTSYIEFKNEKAFLNLNNPDEYKEALTLI